MTENKIPTLHMQYADVSTETIDFDNLWPKDVTSSGSFDVRRRRVGAFGKLLGALPMPALLVDRNFTVLVSNEACGLMHEKTGTGASFAELFPYSDDAEKARELVQEVYADRKTKVGELVMSIKKGRVWGRVHFRSMRIGEARAILVLVEDLTLEKKQLVMQQRHQEELKAAHRELEQRVKERTKELLDANVKLEQEVAQRKLAEEHIRASLIEKEALLQEVHHRVKNNLQIISSLLALQSSRSESEKTSSFLDDCQSRIRSMALIHEQLYRSEDLAKIDFSEYLASLTKALLRSNARLSDSISLNLQVDRIFLTVGTALPCGLIVNELVSNSLEHAFVDGTKGEIRVALRAIGPFKYELVVADNGVGLPPGTDYRRSNSLGLKLVTRLAEAQLRGRLDVRSDKGAEIRIVFEDREEIKKHKGPPQPAQSAVSRPPLPTAADETR